MKTQSSSPVGRILEALFDKESLVKGLVQVETLPATKIRTNQAVLNGRVRIKSDKVPVVLLFEMTTAAKRDEYDSKPMWADFAKTEQIPSHEYYPSFYVDFGSSWYADFVGEQSVSVLAKSITTAAPDQEVIYRLVAVVGAFDESKHKGLRYAGEGRYRIEGNWQAFVRSAPGTGNHVIGKKRQEMAKYFSD